MKRKFLLAIILITSLSSCAVVKEYQMVRINDPHMALGDKTSDRFILTFHAYREAAVGANSGKTGGGCGCN